MRHTLELLGIIVLAIYIVWMITFGCFVLYKFLKEV